MIWEYSWLGLPHSHFCVIHMMGWVGLQARNALQMVQLVLYPCKFVFFFFKYGLGTWFSWPADNISDSHFASSDMGDVSCLLLFMLSSESLLLSSCLASFPNPQLPSIQFSLFFFTHHKKLQSDIISSLWYFIARFWPRLDSYIGFYRVFSGVNIRVLQGS